MTTLNGITTLPNADLTTRQRWDTLRLDGKQDAVSSISMGIVPETMHAITEDQVLNRITVNPAIFGGKPIVRGLRIAVEHVLGMLAAGDTPEKLLADYPFLEPADIQACIAYAHRSLAGEHVYERIEGAP